MKKLHTNLNRNRRIPDISIYNRKGKYSLSRSDEWEVYWLDRDNTALYHDRDSIPDDDTLDELTKKVEGYIAQFFGGLQENKA